MGAETEDRDQKGHKDGKSHAGIKNGSNRETERICSGSIPLRTQYASDFWMGPATLTHWKGPIREANNLNREEKKKRRSFSSPRYPKCSQMSHLHLNAPGPTKTPTPALPFCPASNSTLKEPLPLSHNEANSCPFVATRWILVPLLNYICI